MSSIPPRRQASEKTFDAVVKAVRKRRVIPDIRRVKADGRSATIIFVTSAGEVRCPVTKDDDFAYIEVPEATLDPCYLKLYLFLAQ